MTRLSVFAIAFALAGQLGLYAQAPPPQQLQIKILEGEGALNNIKQQTAREPIVQVEDENHRPVAGALVIFSLPQSGPSGTFAGGNTVFNGVTDINGQATATSLTPNKIIGKYQIQVNAKYHNLTGHTSINQSNFMGANVTAAHAATHAFPAKVALIVAGVAGAAAVAVVVATHSGSSSPATSASAAPAGTTITAGTPTVGAP